MPSLFPIVIEVEELMLGTVLRKLNGMQGVAKMHLDLGGKPGASKFNGAAAAAGVKTGKGGRVARGAALQLLLAALKKPMPRSELIAHLNDQGVNGASAVTRARNLKLVENKRGKYSINAKGTKHLSEVAHASA
jgi:hypothetical protein